MTDIKLEFSLVVKMMLLTGAGVWGRPRSASWKTTQASAVFTHTNLKLEDVLRDCGGFEGGLSLTPAAIESVVVSRSR